MWIVPVLLVVASVAIGAWIGWTILVYVTVPALLAASAAGLVVGAAVALWSYLRALLLPRPEHTVTAMTPGWFMRRPVGSAPPDHARPHYFCGQASQDIMVSLGTPNLVAFRLLSATVRRLVALRLLNTLAWPIALPATAFALATAIGLYATWLTLAVLVLGVNVVGWLVGWAMIGVARSADRAVQWWRGASASCPQCHGWTRIPAYRCGNLRCDRIHRDLRSSWLGILWRRCECGGRMPASLLRAGRRLTPRCPWCDERLHDRAAVVGEVTIAISGGPGVGKTHLLRASLTSLAIASEAGWVPADDQSAAWFTNVLTRPERSTPTAPAKAVRVSIRRADGHRAAYLNLYDAAGIHYLNDHSGAPLAYLGTTTAHLFALDPTSIAAARDRLAPAPRPASTDAELPYRSLVAKILRYGLNTRRCSLAVVITKVDLLIAAGTVNLPAHLADQSGWTRSWLRDVGLANLVRAAEGDFKQVRYFLAARRDAVPNDLDPAGLDPARPIAWLVRRTRGIGAR